jgi:chromosome segregation ATPase|tara:strand:- start:24 stop:188 length:165 start_codon:yes stop_codon:yes gene_type:complete
MTGPHVEDHLSEWQEVEQERDYYQAQYEAIQKELVKVKKELDDIKKVYFKDGHF